MTGRKVDEHVEIEAEEARGAETGNGVRYMLIVGVILVVVGFIVVAGTSFG